MNEYSVLRSQGVTVSRPEGICPVCNGTKRRAVPEDDRGFVKMYSGYDVASDTLECNNCGAQMMFSKATGITYLRREDGVPCTHEYVGRNVGRCLTEYSCKHCPLTFQIDSGD